VSKITFSAPPKTPGTRAPTLAAVLRGHTEMAWSRANQLVERGKVTVDDVVELDPSARVRPGAHIEVDERRAAPKPSTVPIVFEDPQVIVIDKPAGISSVPFEKGDGDTAMDAIRDAWRADGRKATTVPLHVVHRIDKDTSGLLAFAKTKPAEKAMQALFRAHDVERTYLCVVHGHPSDLRIESRLVEDRGDGLRGSTRIPGKGKRAVTHVKVIEKMPDTTLLQVKLETGKTHQIRIHLSEAGHPLVGERVYVRDYLRKKEPIEMDRLLLHAATLGFAHPTTGTVVRLESKLPPAFTRALNQLRARPPLAKVDPAQMPFVKNVEAPRKKAALPAKKPSGTRSARGAGRSPRG
jgi:23S rRNA pseudouridine1911/1915/1917 synthase